MMTRSTGIVLFVLLSLFANAQGDQQVRAKADALFEQKNYAEALAHYSQLVSLAPSDRVLNYKFGTCLLFGGSDKGKAIGHLKFATQDPAIPPDAWYWLGRAYHLNYQFKDALVAYQRYQGTGSKKELEGFPIAALDKQCRNGMNLLSNLKEITVHNKVEVDDTEFFRFYELGDIGGKIVVLPEELKSPLDKKSKRRTVVYLPEKSGPIYFASYGKEGKTGLDIYRTELLTNGTFSTPVKLAGYVNTDQDEDFAFLHPDGRSFYFSSKGHNSMGGYDVFRSAYDKVSETFGPPENLDFAVNTPDDELFYMTDGENKQACFASGRDSRQGKLHVYRVGTAQVPVVVTVMKGTFASAIDQNDRKAHIMVEDAVTRERVADVRTDINGSYVLAFPRSGKFRYLVECGPSGRTHTGVVDVPRSNSARAFRQELELTRKGDLEELVIRNYFDAPLEEDMIDLMMAEIKRRARLDVTGERPAIATPVAEPEPAGDVLTRAGFSGDVTEAQAVQMAKDDAREQEQLVQALEQQSAVAYTAAVDAASAADQAARSAMKAAEAANAETDETKRNELMKEAALLRQQSRTANLRARAAHRAATEIDAERMAVQQRANTAGRLATDLSTAVSTNQQDATLAGLRQLKERLDTKNGPNGDLPLAERTRRTLSEQEKEAARRMNMAAAKRAEETELAGQIERAKREREEAKNKSRKDELSRTIAEQEQQLAYLHAEVEGAFNTAKEHETGTAVMRGQHSLVQHLSTQPSSGGKAPSKEEMASLGQRIAGNETRITAIDVDDRFDALVREPASATESRSFNWQVVGADAVLAATAQPTNTKPRNTSNDAVHADGRKTAVAAGNNSGQVKSAEVPDLPISANDALANAGGAVGEVNGGRDDQANNASNATTGQEGAATSVVVTNATGREADQVATNERSAGTNEGTAQNNSTANTAAADRSTNGVNDIAQNSGSSVRGSDVPSANETSVSGQNANTGGTNNANEDAAANNGNTQRTPVQANGSTLEVVATTERSTTNTANNDVASTSTGDRASTAGNASAASDRNSTTGVNDQGTEQSNLVESTDQQRSEVAQRGSDTNEQEVAASSGETFLLENERAELLQAMAAERNATKRATMQARITEIDQRMAANEQQRADSEASESEMSMDDVDMQRTPIIFFPTTKDGDLVTMLYPGYETDKRKLNELSDPVAKAEGLSGLELMLADSLRGEMVRQAAILELAPQQGEVVLPRIERLRAMRQQHVAEAERITRVAAEAELADASEADQRDGLARSTSGSSYPAGRDPVADRFIYKEPDPQEIYESKVEHRSTKVAEAVAARDVDLEKMRLLDERIDALELGMNELPRKEYEKKRREADKLIDERMIIRSELGLRSAYLTKEEWRTSNDSLKTIDKRISTLGLAPNENILLMSEGMRSNAKALFSEGEALRKRADRTEDIILRDSLLRTAYGVELEALDQADRAITVKTYLFSDRFQRGESLPYDEIARRALGIQEELILAQNTTVLPKSTATNSATENTPAVQENAADNGPTTDVRSGNDLAGNEAAQYSANEQGNEDVATDTRTSNSEENSGDRLATSGNVSNTSNDIADRTDVGTGSTTDRAANSTQAAGSNTTAGTASTTNASNTNASPADLEKARNAANELADGRLSTLPGSARMPVKRYETFLTGESVMLKSEALDPALDPARLTIRAEQASRESAELEQRSLAQVDLAASLEDSATTARKRDRERLTELALRTRLEADSLHERSLAMAEEARSLELQKRDAEQAKVLRDRLVKYYYLNDQEQTLVLDDEDMSRYFQMKAKAHEQRDAAAEAENAARVNRELSDVLRKEADATANEVRQGRISASEATAKREVLYDRAEMLSARADSLSNISARLRGAANINESQAGVILQGAPAERSTEWMAMEMRTRRTEQQLAQSGGVVVPAAERATVGGNEGIAQAAQNAQRNNTATSTAAPARQISAPFGTDPRNERPTVARPIAEIPVAEAPEMVFPEVLVNDMFAFRSTGERKPAPIAMDARLPSGIVFKVQIGAFRSPISEENFSDMTPVMGEHTETGFIRYTAGLFTGFQQAAKAKDRVRDRGYRDAFVVAYRDGVRIPLGEAMREARAQEQAERLAANNVPSTSTNSAGTNNAAQSGAQGGTSVPNTTPAQPRTSTTNEVATTNAQRPEGNTVLEPARSSTTTSEPVTAVIQRPLPTTPAPALTTEDILAKYPTTAEAIVEAFVPAPEAAAYYNVPGAAPATQVETIKGLFYTVQVGVYSKPVPLDKLFNIVPLNSERTETAKVRYTTGRYTDTEQARLRKDQAVTLGVKDAFVTAYLNGKRIPMQEAAALLQQFGPAILAKP